MKLILIIMLSIASGQVMAWGGDLGKVDRLWSNGWDGAPDDFCFEIIRDSGEKQLYGIRVTATKENKNRVFSILLASQMSSKNVTVFYHPDASTGPVGPVCSIRGGSYPSRGVQSVSVIP